MSQPVEVVPFGPLVAAGPVHDLGSICKKQRADGSVPCLVPCWECSIGMRSAIIGGAIGVFAAGRRE